VAAVAILEALSWSDRPVTPPTLVSARVGT